MLRVARILLANRNTNVHGESRDALQIRATRVLSHYYDATGQECIGSAAFLSMIRQGRTNHFRLGRLIVFGQTRKANHE